MSTLLLRIAAPMQSWGDESKYDIRGTRKEPSKSGIIGLISASMGLKRDSKEISRLSENLRMGVRVDQPGTIIRDFHTALSPKYSNDGSLRYDDGENIIMGSNYVTERYYLSDAVFLVGLECQKRELLEKLLDSLKNPIYPLYLGRKSCPVTLPLSLEILDTGLEAALKSYRWVASDWYKDRQKSIHARIIIETENGKNAWHMQMDQPVSFNPVYRKYSLRGLDKEQYTFLGMPEHDPMSVL